METKDFGDINLYLLAFGRDAAYRSLSSFLNSKTVINPKKISKILKIADERLIYGCSMAMNNDIKKEIRMRATKLLEKTTDSLFFLLNSKNLPNEIKYVLTLEFLKIMDAKIYEDYPVFDVDEETLNKVITFQRNVYWQNNDSKNLYSGCKTELVKLLKNNFYSSNIRNLIFHHARNYVDFGNFDYLTFPKEYFLETFIQEINSKSIKVRNRIIVYLYILLLCEEHFVYDKMPNKLQENELDNFPYLNSEITEYLYHYVRCFQDSKYFKVSESTVKEVIVKFFDGQSPNPLE